MSDGRTTKTLSAILFVFLIVTCGYVFFRNPVDSVMARMDLAYSIVFNHELDINEYHENTVDKALYKGNYYYTGGPGAPFAAAAVLAGYRAATGDSSRSPYNEWPLRLITILLVSLPAAIFAVLLFRYLIRDGGGTKAGFVVATAFAAGTVALPYSALFYPYVPATLLCFLAFVMAVRQAGAAQAEPLRIATSGFLISFATICSFEVAPLAAAVAVYQLFALGDKRRFAFFALGAVPPAAALLVYNNACFGGPLSFGYFHLVNKGWSNSAGEFYAIFTKLSLSRLWGITFEPGRGLFWVCPFLILCMPGFESMFKRRELRGKAALCLIVAVAYLYLNSTFFDVQGGMSPGPKYLIPAIPFMCIPIYVWLCRTGAYGRVLFYSLAAVSVVQMFLVTAADPHVPVEVRSPVYAYALPMILEGCIPWNAGQVVGLKGAASFIPFGIFAILCGVAAIMTLKKGRGVASEQAGGRIGAGAIVLAACVAVCFVVLSYLLSDVRSAAAVAMRGTVFLQSGKREKAREEFTLALDDRGIPDRERASILMSRGLAYELDGNFSAAVKDYNAAAAASGDCDNVKAAAKAIRYYEGDIRRAARMYGPFFDDVCRNKLSNNDLSEANLTIGIAAQIDGNMKKALDHYRKAAEETPEAVEPHQRIANLYIEMYNRTKRPEYLSAVNAERKKIEELKAPKKNRNNPQKH